MEQIKLTKKMTIIVVCVFVILVSLLLILVSIFSSSSSAIPKSTLLKGWPKKNVLVNLTVATSSDDFVFNLYNLYKDKKENIFFSPYSISSALSMVYEGARGKTAEEINKTLNLGADIEKYRSGFSDNMSIINQKNDNYKLSVANALWAENSYKFNQEYFKLIENVYGGKVSNLDFFKNAEKSRATINA